MKESPILIGIAVIGLLTTIGLALIGWSITDGYRQGGYQALFN